MKRTVLPLFLLFACAPPETAFSENPYLVPYFVHWVGNSLTYNHDIPGKFLQIAKSQKLVPSETKIQKTLKGGHRLRVLFDEFAVKQLLNPSRFIVLQEQSRGPRSNNTVEIIGMYRNIADLSGAQIILYATWDVINDVRDLRACKLDTDKDTFSDFAKRHKLLLAPVSSVWVAACRNNIQSDLVPVRPGPGSWTDYHANLAGAYAAAQTFLRVMFPQKTVYSAPPTFGLPPGDVQKIQNAAISVLPKTALTQRPVKKPVQSAKVIQIQKGETVSQTIAPCRAQLFTIQTKPTKLLIEADRRIQHRGSSRGQALKALLFFRDDGTIVENEMYPSDQRFRIPLDGKTYFVFVPNQRENEDCGTTREYTIKISLDLARDSP